ncbi:hypothetical protein OIU79_001495, partial [Salix purpurea]
MSVLIALHTEQRPPHSMKTNRMMNRQLACSKKALEKTLKIKGKQLMKVKMKCLVFLSGMSSCVRKEDWRFFRQSLDTNWCSTCLAGHPCIEERLRVSDVPLSVLSIVVVLNVSFSMVREMISIGVSEEDGYAE